MRKVIVLMHTSLDGYLAGPSGEMNWIKFDAELADYVGKLTEDADAAVWGRITYSMMEGYWPTAGEQPGASKHDIEHANWVNAATKIVFSTTMEKSDWKGTRIIKSNMKEEMEKFKKQPGKNILLIGSASIAHAFMKHDLIDEYWININPVLLGSGIPLFLDVQHMKNLKLKTTKTFKSGVLGVQYEAI